MTEAGKVKPGRVAGLWKVGVTGHRSDQLRPADLPLLRHTISQTLRRLQEQSTGRIALVSPLADGADQIAAEEALRAGFELHCPLPFPRTIYESDFVDDDALHAFRSLLSRATRVEEINGSRDSAESERAAYLAAGQQMLDDADWLIAIWNGEPARGAGGTAEIVELARAMSIPISWISSTPPHAVQTIGSADGKCELHTEKPDVRRVDLLRPLHDHD